MTKLKSIVCSRRRSSAVWMVAFVFALTATAVSAQELVPHNKPNYKQAMKYSSQYLRQFTYSSSIRPGWIGQTDRFWYSYRTSQGTRYYLVDPESKSKELLFDHDKMAAELSVVLKKPQNRDDLQLGRISFDKEDSNANVMKFVAGGRSLEYDRTTETLTDKGKAPTRSQAGRGQRSGRSTQGQRSQRGRSGRDRRNRDHRAMAPDKKVYAFAKDHNLYFSEVDKEDEAIQLTTDGVDDYSFGGRDGKKSRPRVNWSKDSQAFYVTRRDSRGVNELYLVNSLAQPRPTLEKYKYAMPGEDEIPVSELHLFHRETKKLIPIEAKWKDESYQNVHWGSSPDKVRFVRRDRLIRNVELCEVDVKSGECKTLLAEGMEGANIATQSIRYINDDQDMIWWSERTGWGHFYLYSRDGELKNAITSGPFRASRIVAIDQDKNILYFYGNAREKNENIYNQHLYRVFFDGSGLTLLDEGNANHRSTLSPSRKYLVDNCSRIDMAPRSILRDSEGNKVMDLEEMDLSRLKEAGWRMPETFVVKAADGITDLYGNMWRPFDFNPKKKYPVIAHVYPGPQTEGVSHSFSTRGGQQQLANIGFIVIQVGHRGGTPTRSKAYHSYGYYNLRDYGLADKKAAIEQLAARFPFVDVERVGIYGHSGGGFMSAAAMLREPYNNFFKVAVASAGNHDNNVYNHSWSERYHGLRVVKDEQENQRGQSRGNSERRSSSRGRRESGRRSGGERSPRLQDQQEQQEENEEEKQTENKQQSDQQKDKQQQKVTEKQKETKEEKKQEQKEEQEEDKQKQKDSEKQKEKSDDQDDGDQEKEDQQQEDQKDQEEDQKDQEKDDDQEQDQKKDEDHQQQDKDEEEEKTRLEIHVPTNAELAANLKGHLLLVHGEIDNNVHPAGTMRLVDALIKANKRFDMLIIPGKRHGFGDAQQYFQHRMWEYFAEHLLDDRQTGADILNKQ